MIIEGVFVQNMPLISVTIGSALAAQSSIFILDTGFTGDLQVTPKIAYELGLETTRVAQTCIASGEIIELPISSAVADMDGIAKIVQILISDSLPLAGISFFTKFGFTTCVDCKNRKVILKS